MKPTLYIHLIFASLLLTPFCGKGQIITTYAGSTLAGYSGDDGPATDAKLNGPMGLAVDDSGNLFIADKLNNVIRKVTPTGIISTYAGNNTAGYSGDGGPASDASINTPYDIATDHAGNIYFTDYGNNAIRKVSNSGIITTVPIVVHALLPGACGLPGVETHMLEPTGIAINSAGTIYFVNDALVLKVGSSDTATTFAGNGCVRYTGDGGPATNATLNNPIGLACDQMGNVYIGDEGNNAVRKVNSAGIITTCAGTGASPAFYGDGGMATDAGMDGPFGVATDNAGNLYIQDIFNRRIRKVDVSTGIIHTIAGNGIRAYTGDGGPATDASFYDCTGLAVDNSGDFYIADFWYSVVRKVTMISEPSLGIPQHSSANNLVLYPNPNNGVFYIKCSFNSIVNENATIEVTDLVGQQVYSNDMPVQNGIINTEIILNNNLANGMYVLNVRSGAESDICKFVIQR